MGRRRKTFVAGAVLVLILGGSIALRFAPPGEKSVSASEAMPEATEVRSPQGAVTPRATSDRRTPNGTAAASFRDVETLNDLWQQVAGLPPAEEGALLVRFLDSGQDGDTGLPFQLGTGGRLVSSPTLRVAALNRLGEVDSSRAAEYARQVFAGSNSADEWALALRNYGRALSEPSEDAYFAARLHELLANDEWIRSPSAGYLEAFDAVVYSGRPDLATRLAALQEAAGDAHVRRAALISLDSMAVRQATDVAEVLLNDPRLLSDSPGLRSGLFARLDPRDPKARQQLEAYVAREDLTPEEWQGFAQQFPNANLFGGHFLLTQTQARDLADQALLDGAAFALVQEWKGDSSFPANAEVLGRLDDRLRAFVGSAARAGFLPREGMQ